MERPDDLEPGLPEGQAAEPEQLAQAEGEADSGEETADSGEEEEPTLAGPRPEAQADSALPRGRSRHPVLARIARIAAIALIGVAGAWLGMLLAGGASVQIGPVQTLMALRPSISGQTVVNVPPLGSLQMNTNHGPLQLNIDVRQLNETDVKQLVADPKSVASLPDIASAQLKHGVIAATIRAVVAAAIGSLVLGLIAFRRIWPTLAACGIAIGVLGIAGAIAATSLNPKSVLEPRYTGLLAEAPSLVGSTQNLVTKFGLYRTELAQLVTNVTRLYDTTADLPVYQPDTDAVRVLDVSDIHDNPAAWNIMHSIVQQFGINLIIDSGDLTDHGSQAENELAAEIRKFPVPYVFIKGNHDSGSTQSAVAKVRNAILLTGHEVTVDGLTIIGDGDPRFTPNLSVQVRGEEAVYQTGQKLATAARGMVHEPDIAVVHDPVSALPLNGAVKLVMAGHLHRRVSWMLSDATRVFVQGSTGGAGLRALQTNPPTPIEASVLYFGRADGQLQAWDDITIGGLGATDAQIQRHLASDTAPVGGPVPELGPTVSPSTMCGTPG
ncbi:MAG TPA: metallophosphoesterase, partial [Streptosporangiaceae bacterium]